MQVAAYPDRPAPADTLVFLTGTYLPESVVLRRTDDPSIEVATTVLLSTGVNRKYLIAQPGRLLGEGSWEIFNPGPRRWPGVLARFDVLPAKVPAPQVPIPSAPVSTHNEDGFCGMSDDYVTFTFPGPADFLAVRIDETTADNPPPAFELFGQTVHALVPRKGYEERNRVNMGSTFCGADIPLAPGETAKLSFAAVNFDGRISAWSGDRPRHRGSADQAPRVPKAPTAQNGGCSVLGALGGSASGAAWVWALVLGARIAAVRRSKSHPSSG